MPRGRKDNKGESAQMDSLYTSDDFRMYCFKVLPCSKNYCHDWTECPFAHAGEKARRRDPRLFPHMGIECPQLKEESGCPRGELCPFAHNVFECWLHPTRYRTQLCNEPASCKRKVCFFAHTVDELREATSSVDQETAVRAPGSDSTSASSMTHAPPPEHQIYVEPENGMPPIPGRSSKSSLELHGKRKPRKGVYHDSPSPGHSRRSSIESCPSRGHDRSSMDAARNGARGTASCDGRPAKGKQSRETTRHSVDVARLARQRQLQDKDSASATQAHLQSLRNEMMARQLGLSPNDLTAALEQISLASTSPNNAAPLQIQPQLQNVMNMMNVQEQASLATAGLSQNDRVVQLFLMLLKEITESRAQSMRTSSDFPTQRSSLDSTFSVGSGVPGRPSVSSDRISVDGLANGQFAMLQGAGLHDPARGLYVPAPAGQLGVDGLPDFILHDSQQRGPSIDSTHSDTVHLNHSTSYPRLSTESGYEPSLGSRGSMEQHSVSVDGMTCNTSVAPQMLASGYIDFLGQTSSGVEGFSSIAYSGSVPDFMADMNRTHRS